MIIETLNRETVLSCLEKVQRDLEAMAGALGGRRGDEAMPADFSDLTPDDFEAAHESIAASHERETAESSGQKGFADEDALVPPRRGGDINSSSIDVTVFLSRDPDICALQSAMDEYFSVRVPDRIAVQSPEEPDPTDSPRRAAGDEEDEGAGRSSSPTMVTDRYVIDTESNRRIFDNFSVGDIRWISCVFAMAKRKYTKKHPFVASPAVSRIADESRLIVVGDWASGLPRAIKVADQMREALRPGINRKLEQHAIHLGDTYYSGWPSEYQRRFIPWWPVNAFESKFVSSWSLNANHDMYSGGEGYYETLLKDPRFAGHAGCSYFALHSKHWRVLGLDTGWIEGDLEGPQLEWVRTQCDEARANEQRVLLLSHHQLVSSYEHQGKRLESRLGELLKAGKIDAWIWGHEHRCMVYEPGSGLQYAACVGHGGVPVYMYHRDNGKYPAPGIFEDRRYIRSGAERWAYMGFCVLDFNGPRMSVRYLDENGECIRPADEL